MWTLGLMIVGGCLEPEQVAEPEPLPTMEIDCGGEPVAALERWPYVQSVTSSSAIVAWGTTTDVTDTVLQYGDVSMTESATPTSQLLPIGETDEILLHHVELSALTPSTTYCYAVRVGGERRTWNLRFRTAPDRADSTVRFLAIGDFGAGTPDQLAVREAMMAHADDVDFMLTTGDNAYSSGDWDEVHFNVFRIYQELLSRVPMFPTLGNHDYSTEDGQPYLDNFFLPRNALRDEDVERYYSMDFGPLHFVALDSEDSILQVGDADDDQLDWLDADLAASEGHPWVVPAFHQPVFTNHPSRSPNIFALGMFVPRFEEHDVRVVLTGHNHHYERSVPLRGQLAADDGITYVVSGGGGRGLYDLVIGEDPLQAAGAMTHHFLLGEADACTLKLQAIDAEGVVFDEVVFDRCP